MMEATAEALIGYGADKPLVTAVTVLTSMSQAELNDLNVGTDLLSQVLHLASMAKQMEMDGVVCSAHEVSDIKQTLGHAFLGVTPGIRLAQSSTDDQHRIITPQDAIKAGSDYLVIGRPITSAKNPSQVTQSILASLQTLD